MPQASVQANLPAGKLPRPAEDFFEHWPDRPLTTAEAALRQQMSAYTSLGGMLHAYILHRGVLFEAAALPADVAKGTKRECYRNAGELALAEPEKYAYVEGYAHSVLAVSHAWCVTRDGQVVDPTWDDAKQCAYVGIPMATEFLSMQVLKSKVWGVFGEMPRRATLATPLEEMVHPWWREAVAARPKWSKLEAALGG